MERKKEGNLMAGKTIAVVATLDTKGRETAFLKQLIEARGHRVLLLDTNTGGEPSIPADISAGEIAKSAGGDIEEIRRSKDTHKASSIMVEGASKIVNDLLERGELHGIISFGGASNTAMGTSIMKSLPFGIPKLMVSSTAAMPAYAGGYFGTKDITILHSVVDIAGLNPLVRDILKRGAGAICGMVEEGKGFTSLGGDVREKPLVALTEFKFSEKCCSLIRKLLPEHGFEVIPFHAQGISDQAMEELIGEGLFKGVMDIVPAGVAEELLGGNRAAGPNRLERAGEMGIPQIVTPCGFEMLSCGPLERGEKNDPLWISRNIKERKSFIPDPFRVQARTTAEELQEIARAVAEKLNRAKGPVAFLIPRRGWSSLSEEGRPLHDPETDRVFVEELKEKLNREIPVIEVDVPLNSPEFAEEAVKWFLKLTGEK
ncbi:MAG: Tm-1-like ATP-binding domain-containing protein [Deltaproteobacteria bacterium]|nr:Tm-1-like ATP-binding domain-containing protein [Deltaproteobacteria bacterium]MBW2128485.1 Tm-1-like ATP-binding domain-containing protein [Deltaproteobacteria bacterium]MBW2303656.1 Tm-1-like ATP-binding domain-containing protein [Deltaproteobacteria bacterium]